MSKVGVANERKLQIVSATIKCISRCGYHNFSMQDVAKTAGVSKGIIHYYFLNKDDLMTAVLEQVSDNIQQVLRTNLERSSGPAEKLETFLSVCLSVVKDIREYYQVHMDFWTQINQKNDVKLLVAEHYRSFRSTCIAILDQGVKEGVFQKICTLSYASYILAIIDGISLQWLFDHDAFDHDTISKELSSIVMAGLRPSQV